MPDKSNFTPDEWKLLLESVMMAGIAVSAAEPSGLWGLLKESFAESNALMTAKLDPRADALIKAVVADFETADGRCSGLQGLAAPDQPARCRGLQGGWISRHRRRGGERGREGNTYRNRKCTEARGLNRSLGPRPSDGNAPRQDLRDGSRTQ